MRSGTLPKKWVAEGWVDLGSDVNWEDYHGMWGRPARHEFKVWYVLRFTNMEDAAGERGAKEMGIRYECSVFRVDMNAVTEEKKKAVLDSFSFTDNWPKEQWHRALIYGLVSDGCAAPMHEESAWSYPTRVRAAAKRAADLLMDDYDMRESLLDRPINAIGTTAREVGQDDLLAGLRRYANGEGEPDEKKDLMLRIGGVPAEVKRVKQRDLSGECLAVQIWGTAQCTTCSYRNRGCGGKEIRKTGVNEKGVVVGRTGL